MQIIFSSLLSSFILPVEQKETQILKFKSYYIFAALFALCCFSQSN